MKCVNLQKIKALLILTALFSCISLISTQNANMYQNKGLDWPGLCNTGSKQSPINIIDERNTELSTSYVEFSYSMPEKAFAKKLYYDGDKVFMDINLGNVTYHNAKGAKEHYTANRIELHFPAEHYITIEGQTPRYALEVQIYHSLVSSDNAGITNEHLKVTKAAVSILFTLSDLDEGDIFLNQLGISKYNTDDTGAFMTAKKNNNIDRKKIIPATFGVGFSYLAFQGLLNLINTDPHLYFYYGSETKPPCREEILWMVFARPRSMAKPQFDYLLLMLAKNKNPKMKLTDAQTPNQLFGNKRSVILYDEELRGKVASNPMGLKHVKSKAFFRS